MANERVSQLNGLLASELQSNDLFLITDMSLRESKKIEFGQLILFLQSSSSFNTVHAQNSDSSSYVLATRVDGIVRSASYADMSYSSSYALITDTTISASYALRATSASWAPSIAAQTTTSYALQSGYAVDAGIAYFLYYNGQPNGTASWAESASWAPGVSAATYTSSLFGTSSWAVNASSASYAKRTGMVFDTTYFTESKISAYTPTGLTATLRTYLPYSPDYYPQTSHKYTLRSYITSGMTKYYSDPIYYTIDDEIPTSGWKVDVSWNAVDGVTGYYLEMSASTFSNIQHFIADSFTGSTDIPSPATITFLDEGTGSWGQIQLSFPPIDVSNVVQYISFNSGAFPLSTTTYTVALPMGSISVENLQFIWQYNINTSRTYLSAINNINNDVQYITSSVIGEDKINVSMIQSNSGIKYIVGTSGTSIYTYNILTGQFSRYNTGVSNLPLLVVKIDDTVYGTVDIPAFYAIGSDYTYSIDNLPMYKIYYDTSWHKVQVGVNLDLISNSFINSALFKQFEPLATNELCFLFNPVKNRFYLMTGGSSYLHILNINSYPGTIEQWWDDAGRYSYLVYQKTTALLGNDVYWIDNTTEHYSLEYDFITGKEYAITTIRKGIDYLNGSVIKIPWVKR